MTAAAIPAEPGTYVLVLRCASTRAIRIGLAGALTLKPGWFLYVGSAFGPGGLAARVSHHARRAVRPHWHVDHLRRHTVLEAVWCACGARREHEWAAAISAMPGDGRDAGVREFGFPEPGRRCRVTRVLQGRRSSI